MLRLETERLVLRPFEDRDAPALLALFGRPDVSCFFDERLESLGEALLEARRRRNEREGTQLAVCRKESGGMIGNVFSRQEGPDTWSAGWIFDRRFQGRGYAGEAARVYVDFLFSRRGARRVFAYVEEGNLPSRRLCERLGMRFEAVTHQLPDRSEKELPYFAERFYASAERAALEWLSRSHRPKAVVCYNEFQALAMVNAAHQAGIRVPEQLSVISFDSLDISGYSSPPLTAIRQNFDQLGREAAKRLFDRMDDGTSAICEVLIPPELIVRKSTAPCQK